MRLPARPRTGHSDIKKIALDVLLAFYLMELKTSVRKIKYYVKNFRDIQYGEVKENNMLSELQGVLDTNSKRWKELRELWPHPDKLVQIHRQPDWPDELANS